MEIFRCGKICSAYTVGFGFTGGILAVTFGHAKTGSFGKLLYCLHETHPCDVHKKTDDITTLTAAEAMVKLPFTVYIK